MLPETTYQLLCFEHAERIARAADARRARTLRGHPHGSGWAGRAFGRPPHPPRR